MSKKLKTVITLVVITGAMAVLIGSGLKNNTGSYLTIKEALAIQESSAGEYIQMEGYLKEGSTVWNPESVTLEFTLTNNKDEIKITYNGVKPDNFDSGYPIIVEGQFNAGSRFNAEAVKVKCPSKYEAESEEAKSEEAKSAVQ